MKVTIVAIVLFCLSLTATAYADSPAPILNCESQFQSVDTPSPAEIASQSKYLFSEIPEAILERGFISSTPPFTPELAAEVAKKGVVWGFLRIYFADSIASAKALAEANADRSKEGIYLIHQGEMARDVEGLSRLPASYVFEQLTNNRDVYWFQGGGVGRVRREWVVQHLNRSEMQWDVNDPERGPMIVLDGWTFPAW